jgi:hypothetical protein
MLVQQKTLIDITILRAYDFCCLQQALTVTNTRLVQI